IRDDLVTGVQTCALPIYLRALGILARHERDRRGAAGGIWLDPAERPQSALSRGWHVACGRPASRRCAGLVDQGRAATDGVRAAEIGRASCVERAASCGGA